MPLASTALAFLRRDARIAVSYRLSAFMQVTSILLSVGILHFLARLVGEGPHLSGMEGGYFPFVVTGVAFIGYLDSSMRSFSTSIREGQINGTLEAIFATPASVASILVSSSLWSFTVTSLRVAGYLLLGALLFGMDLSRANIPAALLVQALSIASCIPIGILSASFILVFKRGDPFAFLVDSASFLLAGVYYPTEVLPGPLRLLSQLLPITHSLEAMRAVLLRGATLRDILPQLLILAAFAAVLLPSTLYIFRRGLDQAKRRGTLAHY